MRAERPEHTRQHTNQHANERTSGHTFCTRLNTRLTHYRTRPSVYVMADMETWDRLWEDLL